MTNQNNGTKQNGRESGLPDTPCSAWSTQSYQSGTKNVSRQDRGPYYNIGYLAAGDDNEHGRSDVAHELETWLNGGEEPWWLDMLKRISAEAVETPHGVRIGATGPMVDEAVPPAWGFWTIDKSEDSVIARGLLINALMKKRRPNL